MRFFRKSNQFSRNRSRPAFGRRPMPKKLDVNLFVRRAIPVEPVSETASSAKFGDYAIQPGLKANIASHGYTKPTPIQEQAIPVILQGKDVIGIAETGTGKTAAFLIPLINKTLLNPKSRTLIVTPTRELASQIQSELYAFAKGMPIFSVLCIGGANLRMQEMRLAQNPAFIIGTPGRLKDLIQRRRLHLVTFGNVVLDEVDRMVDIGFITDVKFLVALLPKLRQSLFFSATVSTKTNEILREFVTDPVTVSVKKHTTAQNVHQDIVRIKDKSKKVDTLHDLLITEGFTKVLVFGRTKWGVEKLKDSLVERGFKAAAIHGNKSQNHRQRTLDQFKKGQLQVLLATDVVSRGLDIDNVTHVINYDEPASHEDYIHRIGRTGRAGKMGNALTFVE